MRVFEYIFFLFLPLRLMKKSWELGKGWYFPMIFKMMFCSGVVSKANGWLEWKKLKYCVCCSFIVHRSIIFHCCWRRAFVIAISLFYPLLSFSDPLNANKINNLYLRFIIFFIYFHYTPAPGIARCQDMWWQDKFCRWSNWWEPKFKFLPIRSGG